MTEPSETRRGRPRPASVTLRAPIAGRPVHIALFGIFGLQNLGNECTLQAISCMLRQLAPKANLVCLAYEPNDTFQRHGLRTFSVLARCSERSTAGARRGTLVRLFRLLTKAIPSEAMGWIRGYILLRGTQLVIMTGTGMLTDYSTTAMGYPYQVWKWATIARMAGARVRFVSVGVGPLYEQWSRRFIKYALAMADYRSYRDSHSKAKLAEIGICTRGDHIYPDLAFSLPKTLVDRVSCSQRLRKTIGLGLINYSDPHLTTACERDAGYRLYLSRMCDLVIWLTQHEYEVRILIGDLKHDNTVRRDLRAHLVQRGLRYEDSGVVDEEITSVEELLLQIEATDVVIAPRFHNQVLALMLAKPVISLSYDPKSDWLLKEFGLARYCESLGDFSVSTLVEHLKDAEGRLNILQVQLREKASEYRELLDEQYSRILAELV